MMKPWIRVTVISAVCAAFTFPISLAADDTVTPVPTSKTSVSTYAAYHLLVQGRAVDTSDLPAPAHNKDGVVMVPLRRTAEALGYTVMWDKDTNQTRLDMSIAYMYFSPGMKDYERMGKLKVININHIYEFGAPPELIEGVLYVPAEVFTAFYNDVSIAGNEVTILPQVSYTTMG